MMSRCLIALILASFPVLPAPGAEWMVATNGLAEGQGTRARPWDLGSALEGKQRVAPGDTLWLQAGTYKYPPKVGGMGYPIKLAGQPGAPIHVRPWQDGRVTIDGGLNVQTPSTHLWIWGLEIMVSEPRPDQPVPPDSTYRNVNRPWGGLNVYSGEGCKFINLVIHDNSQGVSWWVGSSNSELHGCIIYDNGWAGTDRGHGHAIYTQNRDGWKTISDCIMTGGFGYTLHAYGSSRAYVDQYLAEGNLCYNAGTFLIGGGRPSRNVRVTGNWLYGASLQLGYSAPTNQGAEVLDNLVVNGGLHLKNYGEVTNRNNLVLSKNAPRPKGARVILRPNKYEPRRANVAVFNGDKKAAVEVDPGGFLKKGDRFRLLDPRDFFGPPLAGGVFQGTSITVPTADEFAAFVLVRQ